MKHNLVYSLVITLLAANPVNSYAMRLSAALKTSLITLPLLSRYVSPVDSKKERLHRSAKNTATIRQTTESINWRIYHENDLFLSILFVGLLAVSCGQEENDINNNRLSNENNAVENEDEIEETKEGFELDLGISFKKGSTVKIISGQKTCKCVAFQAWEWELNI